MLEYIPWSRHTPPGADTSREQTPPGTDTPGADTPPPREQRPPPRADTPLPPGAEPPLPPGSRLQHTVNERPVRILLECIGGSRGGVRDARPPLGVQILSISCSFRENLACSRPPWRVHAPPSGKSWIRHWNAFLSLIFTVYSLIFFQCLSHFRLV